MRRYTNSKLSYVNVITEPVDPAQSLNASSWEDAAASPKPPGNKRKQSVLGDGQEPEDSDASVYTVSPDQTRWHII